MEKRTVLHENILPLDSTNVNFCTFVDNGMYTPNHWHSAIELKYMLEGKIYSRIENPGTSADTSAVDKLSNRGGVENEVLVPGRCILINFNAIHSDKSMTYSRYILLHIPIEFIERFIPDARYLRFTLNDTTRDLQKLQKINKIKQMLFEMKQLDDAHEKGFLLKFNSILFELLFILYNDFSTKAFTSEIKLQQKDFNRLDKILNYTMENYTRAISLEEISRLSAFSPAYFCRFFKKYMGTTFLEYQNELRLSFIYRDIVETNEPVYKILEKHGFTNYKIFRRMFNEKFGTTPLKIRKQHQVK